MVNNFLENSEGTEISNQIELLDGKVDSLDKEIGKCSDQIEAIENALSYIHDMEVETELEARLEEFKTKEKELYSRLTPIVKELGELKNKNNDTMDKLKELENIGVDVSDGMDIVNQRSATVDKLLSWVNDILDGTSATEPQKILKRR